MKKILLSTSLALIGVLGIGVAGCSCSNPGPNTVDVNAKNVYAMSALSSVNYLEALDGEATNMGASASLDTIDSNHEATIKDCINMFEGMLTNGNVSQDTSKNESTDPELKDYKFIMKVSIPGQADLLNMYYNEINTETEQEIEDEEVEIETSTTLEGVIVIGDKKFDMSGKRTFETEGDESEATIEFTTKSKKNPLNYITVEQSVENNEIEYEYTFYENGKEVNNIEIEVETKKDGVTLELELEPSNGKKTKCKISKKDETSFDIDYTNEGKNIKATASKNEAGEYIFIYK